MEFLQPRSLPEALAVKAERPEAVPIAGGTDVMVEMNFDRRRPPALLDLTRIGALTDWGADGDLLRVWAEDGSLVCEVTDEGVIADPLVGRRRPVLDRAGGRGLWIANQLCDLVQVRSGAAGTTVRLHARLP